MAMALASGGSGFGTIVLGILTTKVINDNNGDGEGWKSAFYMLAAVSAGGVMIPGYFLSSPPTPAAPGGTVKKEPPSFGEVVASPGLSYFMACLFVFSLGVWNPIVHNFEAATDNGFNSDDVGNMISIGFGVGTVLGRPLAAKILEFTGKREGFPAFLLLMAVLAALYPTMASRDDGSLALICVNNAFYGFGFGAFIANLPPITAELVGMEKFPVALGLVYASCATMMIGPPLCGYYAHPPTHPPHPRTPPLLPAACCTNNYRTRQ